MCGFEHMGVKSEGRLLKKVEKVSTLRELEAVFHQCLTILASGVAPGNRNL
jgi:hypothetical protein